MKFAPHDARWIDEAGIDPGRNGRRAARGK
jgi:hypothetical protein